jgi:hypothetical protein
MKCISVLLTTYPGRFSKVIACLSGHGYTHASIGLEDPDTFYSFHFRGFAVETPEKLRKQGVTESCCYRLLISDEAYRRMEHRISSLLAHREAYRYTCLGVWCCLLGLPLRRKRRYFCSQFVAELLERSGALPLRKAPSLYLPNQFPRELERRPETVGILPNLI